MDSVSTGRGKLAIKSDTLKLSVAALMIVAAALMLLLHFSRTDDADRDALFICLHNAEPHEFSVSIRELEAMTDGGGKVYCPECGSDETRTATTCPHCKAPIPQGFHGVTPPACWKCKGKLPNGNVDLFHTQPH
ncbi:MAG: hypothetical protein AAGB48_10890 [Planctomycetota bacterium]